MFKLNEWLINGIINGFERGEFTEAKVTELSAFYFSKGFITGSEVEYIASVCTYPDPPIVEEGEGEEG